MGATAFVFPGQGSQQVGMGAELLQEHPEVFDRFLSLADGAAGLPVRERCLEGPADELTRTDVAQPALFAVSLAVLELVAQRGGLRPDFVAGHSLGEYTAAVASGALGVQDGVALVAERGRLMAEIQAQTPGTMAAVGGLEIDALEELCAQASAEGVVTPANINSPNQIVVSGEEAAVEKLIALAREAGARRALRLPVGAAFHSPLMAPVRARMAEAIEGVRWTDPHTPLAANASGALLRSSAEIRAALIEQIASPVQWVRCVETLVAAGCLRFVEIGPGRVLTGLVRRIAPTAQTLSVDGPGALRALDSA